MKNLPLSLRAAAELELRRRLRERMDHTVKPKKPEISLSEFIRQAWPVLEKRPYVHGYHIDAICEHLEATTTGQIRELMITMDIRTKTKPPNIGRPSRSARR